MRDLGGRYAAYTTRLVDGVLGSSCHTPRELRRSVLRTAAQLSGSGSNPSSPLSQRERGTGGEDATGAPGGGIPAALAAYADKVARHAYQVTDEDLAALQRAGTSDDALFEVTVSAALGAALGRLERGLAALRGESSPHVSLSALSSLPGPLSTSGPHPLAPSPFGRGGTQE